MPRARPAMIDRMRGWRRRLRALLHPRQTTDRMDAELAFHLDMETEKYLRQGLNPDAAHRAARLAFGGVERTIEELRDVRSIRSLDRLTRDLKHASRSMRRAPAFAAAAIGTLALGVGATAALFTVVHAVVLAPLPYADPEGLVRVWETNRAQPTARVQMSPGTFVDLRARSRSLDGIALYYGYDLLASPGTASWVARVANVSPALFDVLGVRPMVGSAFPREDDPHFAAGAAVPFHGAIISYALWQRHFGGRRDIIGRQLALDYGGSPIIGVMPPGFAFPDSAEIWFPAPMSHVPSKVERQFRFYGAVARLRAGTSVGAASHELSAIATQLQAEYPASNAGWSVEVAPLRRAIVGDARPALLALLGLAACLLLIACVNVATLALARAAARRHELAVRMALGAAGSQLAWHWAAEGLLLAVFGGGAGAVVGYWTNRGLLALAPSGIPRLDEVRFGGPTSIVTLLVIVFIALVVGAAPALGVRDYHPFDVLGTRTESGGSGGSRLRKWLVGVQVAVALTLAVAATLLVRSFERLSGTDLGYDRHRVVSAELRVPASRFTAPRPWFQSAQYYAQLVDELSQIPGISEVGGTTRVPLTGDPNSGGVWRTDAPGAFGRKPPTSATDQWKAAMQVVTPRYFSALGIPVLRGRGFTADDRFTEDELTGSATPKPAGAAIINQAMAVRDFPGDDPIGKTIFLFDDQTFAAYRTIVGIVRDARGESVDKGASPTVFLPFAEHPDTRMSFVLRSDLPPARLVPSVTARLHSIDSAIAITNVRPLDDIVGRALSRPRFMMLVVGGFAFLALGLSCIGVFGIVGFLVTSRTQEIGIRMALGARASSVLRLVLGDGLRPVFVGAGIGVIGAAGAARAMRSLLYGVTPFDPVSFIVAASCIIGAASVAAFIPANRAVSVDPLRSLRSD